MKRKNDINSNGAQDKKLKTSENTAFKEEETSLLLSMVDINILQNIFIQLVDQYKYSIYEEEEIKKSVTLLLNFCLSCKLFFEISKKPLFPLILNNININLNYKKYLKILHLKQLVEKNPYYKDKDTNSIFYESCKSGHDDLINTLINYNPNINHAQFLDCWTPLIISTLSNTMKTIKKLIKFKNLNVNQQDSVGFAPLSYACMYEREDIVKILLSRKDIDINIKDKLGRTALDWAKEKNNENIVKMLENYQIELETLN